MLKDNICFYLIRILIIILNNNAMCNEIHLNDVKNVLQKKKEIIVISNAKHQKIFSDF